MKQNVGPLDRVTRIILGVILVGSIYLFKITGIWGDGLIILGGLWIIEGTFGYCLLYGLLGWSTKRRKT